MDVAERLRDARVAAGLTQGVLAEKIGVRQKDISRWEKKERTPSLEMFIKLCKELDVSADKILGLNIK